MMLSTIESQDKMLRIISSELDHFEKSSLGISFLGQLTYCELKEQFEYIEKIDVGGEATIFKVRSKKNNEIYALRLDDKMQQYNLNRREHFFQQMIKSQNKNPHLAKITAVFWLENKNYPFSGAKKKGIYASQDIPEGEFIRTDYSSDLEAISYYHEVTIMELGGKNAEKIMRVDPIFFKIQCVFNNYCLYQTGIKSSDDKSRNYVWMSIENESYNGNLLKNFSYWLYSFGNNIDFYIPQQNYIPKRIDFGDWVIKYDDFKQEINWSAVIARELDIDINELQKIYPKPDIAENEILDMSLLLTI